MAVAAVALRATVGSLGGILGPSRWVVLNDVAAVAGHCGWQSPPRLPCGIDHCYNGLTSVCCNRVAAFQRLTALSASQPRGKRPQTRKAINATRSDGAAVKVSCQSLNSKSLKIVATAGGGHLATAPGGGQRRCELPQLCRARGGGGEGSACRRRGGATGNGTPDTQQQRARKVLL